MSLDIIVDFIRLDIIIDIIIDIIVYWLVVWNMFYVSIYCEFIHPNWRAHIFQRGGSTTNQYRYHDILRFPAQGIHSNPNDGG